MILPALFNPCCFSTLFLDQGSVSWTADFDVDLIRFLNPKFERLPNRDRMSWDCVEIEAVQQTGHQKVQTITCDDPSGANTAAYVERLGLATCHLRRLDLKACEHTCSKHYMPLGCFVQIIIEETLWPEGVWLFELGRTHVHTPAVPKNVRASWDGMPFEYVVLC